MIVDFQSFVSERRRIQEIYEPITPPKSPSDKMESITFIPSTSSLSNKKSRSRSTSTMKSGRRELPASPESIEESSSSYTQNFQDHWTTLEPLSAFPTPPSSSEETDSLFDDLDETFNSLNCWETSEIIGQSKYLTSHLPSSTSRLPQSHPQTLRQILHRSRHLLSPSVLAMTACILDSLSPKFISKWLSSISTLQTSSLSNLYTQTTSDLIISTSLLISIKFLNDRPPQNIHWCIYIFDERWSLNMISFTERCILEDVNYRLGYMCSPDLLDEKIKVLERYEKEEKKRDGLQDWDFEVLGHDDDDDVVDCGRMLRCFTKEELLGFDDDD